MDDSREQNISPQYTMSVFTVVALGPNTLAGNICVSQVEKNLHVNLKKVPPSIFSHQHPIGLSFHEVLCARNRLENRYIYTLVYYLKDFFSLFERSRCFLFVVTVR